jgi:hypothetical protein
MAALIGSSRQLCGKELSAADRKAWQQAIELIVGLKLRNGFGEKGLTAAVRSALRRSASKRMCERCGVKAPRFGLPKADGAAGAAEPLKHGDRTKLARWCTGCAKEQPGAVNVIAKKCEDCKLKLPSFGLPSDKAKGKARTSGARWCSACAKGHAGAENLVARRCEDCQLKRSSHGLPSEGVTPGTARWCAGCAKGHAGAVDAVAGAKKKCEGCGVKHANFGLKGVLKPRWCASGAGRGTRLF